MRSIRNSHAYSLIEVMTVIAVIAVVLGILYAYSGQGWKLFYQSYGRGLSQVKAKLAIRVLSEELREANKSRVVVGRGTSYGVPLPDDAKDSTPYIYFTKPIIYEPTGDITGYEYVLYYFAKPIEKIEKIEPGQINERRIPEEEKYLTLKSIKFLNQSKYYTEDKDKIWPFLPPILELRKSRLPEDEEYLESIKSANTSPTESTNTTATNTQITKPAQNTQDEFLDHFARLKKETRSISISGNFLAKSLTDPFTTEEVSFLFGQEYKEDKPIKIKVSITESPFLFGLKGAMSEFEVKVTPRN